MLPLSLSTRAKRLAHNGSAVADIRRCATPPGSTVFVSRAMAQAAREVGPGAYYRASVGKADAGSASYR